MLAVIWTGLGMLLWASSLVVAFHLGRSSLERDAIYDAFNSVIRKAAAANAIADSVMGELGR